MRHLSQPGWSRTTSVTTRHHNFASTPSPIPAIRCRSFAKPRSPTPIQLSIISSLILVVKPDFRFSNLWCDHEFNLCHPLFKFQSFFLKSLSNDVYPLCNALVNHGRMTDCTSSVTIGGEGCNRLLRYDPKEDHWHRVSISGPDQGLRKGNFQMQGVIAISGAALL